MSMMLAAIILIVPLAAAVMCLAVRTSCTAEGINLFASLLTAAVALPLPFVIGSTEIGLAGYLVVDPLGAWVVLCAVLVYLVSSIYAIGYMRLLGEPQRLRRFYALFAAFAWTTLAAPLMNNAGVYWIAVELTTLVSTFLVGFEHASESIEAAWKYIIVVSAGISLALLIAALSIVRQRGVKRLMAYSSVEHMGVIALGFGFGGALGVAGALYHMLNHALNKSLMFFGAGAMMRAYGTKDMTGIRQVGVHFPFVGALWLAGAVAITGAPPFGLFLSELAILRAGFRSNVWAVATILVLLVVIFAGFLNHFRVMYFHAAPTPQMQAVGTWCVLAMLIAGLPLLILGLWWPAAFTPIFQGVHDALTRGMP